MKTLIAFVVTTLISSTAAAEDWSVIGKLSPSETKTKVIALNPKPSTIEVTASDSNISCQLKYSSLTLWHNNTTKCTFAISLQTSGEVYITIKNNTSVSVNYNVRIQD